MHDSKSQEAWLEGFAKLAETFGITEPDELEALHKVAAQIKISQDYPEQFQKGWKEVLEKSGMEKEAILGLSKYWARLPASAKMRVGLGALGLLGGAGYGLYRGGKHLYERGRAALDPHYANYLKRRERFKELEDTRRYQAHLDEMDRMHLETMHPMERARVLAQRAKAQRVQSQYLNKYMNEGLGGSSQPFARTRYYSGGPGGSFWSSPSQPQSKEQFEFDKGYGAWKKRVMGKQSVDASQEDDPTNLKPRSTKYAALNRLFSKEGQAAVGLGVKAPGGLKYAADNDIVGSPMLEEFLNRPKSKEEQAKLDEIFNTPTTPGGQTVREQLQRMHGTSDQAKTPDNTWKRHPNATARPDRAMSDLFMPESMRTQVHDGKLYRPTMGHIPGAPGIWDTPTNRLFMGGPYRSRFGRLGDLIQPKNVYHGQPREEHKSVEREWKGQPIMEMFPGPAGMTQFQRTAAPTAPKAVETAATTPTVAAPAITAAQPAPMAPPAPSPASRPMNPSVAAMYKRYDMTPPTPTPKGRAGVDAMYARSNVPKPTPIRKGYAGVLDMYARSNVPKPTPIRKGYAGVLDMYKKLNVPLPGTGQTGQYAGLNNLYR